MCLGDMYTNPGETEPLPTDIAGVVAAYEGSALAAELGEMFSESYLSIARAEVALKAENSPDVDEVNDWERARYLEHR